MTQRAVQSGEIVDATMGTNIGPLLEVENLVKHFPIRGGILNKVVRTVHAVNGVSFTLGRGETLGVVGE